MRRAAWIWWLVAAARLAAAQATADPDSTVEEPVAVQLWPPEVTTLGSVWTPQMSYSTNSGVGFGLETLRPFRIEDDRRGSPSTLSFYVKGTTRGHWRVNTACDLRWGRDTYHLRLRFEHDDHAREFYGLGPGSDTDDPDVYRPGSSFGYIEGTVGVGDHLALGPRFEAHHQTVHDVPPDGRLASQVARGLDGGWALGYGLVANYDTRDCRLRACRGVYLQGMALTFPGRPGDHAFEVGNLDLRGYLPLANGSTLAAQLFYYGVGGEPPFWRLAAIGGRDHTRAYARDRWLDEHLLAGQVEWRWRPWRRIGVVAFAGLATVAPEPSLWRARYLRPTLGAGMRLFRDATSPVPIRLDLALGYQSVRAVLAVGEAF
ncbi:hypothetical protein GF314_04150 [bacterium]|nr:hypothetical protein [bacterium]